MKIILINAAKQQCSSFNYIDCEGSKPFSNTFSSRWWTFSRFHWSDLKKDSSSSLFIKTKRHEHIEAFDTSGLYGCRNLMWRPGCPHSWRVLVHQWVYWWRDCQLHPVSHLESKWIIISNSIKNEVKYYIFNHLYTNQLEMKGKVITYSRVYTRISDKKHVLVEGTFVQMYPQSVS